MNCKIIEPLMNGGWQVILHVNARVIEDWVSTKEACCPLPPAIQLHWKFKHICSYAFTFQSSDKSVLAENRDPCQAKNRTENRAGAMRLVWKNRQIASMSIARYGNLKSMWMKLRLCKLVWSLSFFVNQISFTKQHAKLLMELLRSSVVSWSS